MRRVLPFLLLIAACGEGLPFEPAGPDAAPDPSAYGPYPVGVQTLTVVDPRRFDPDTRIPRILTVEVWYPARASARGQPGAVYPFEDFLPDEYDEAARSLGGFETGAVRDAEAVDGERFPLVLFSHGSGGVRVQSTFLTEYLASHGYVVAAPDHKGNTLEDVLAAGTIDITSFGQSFLDRPADILMLIDALDGKFSFDPKRVGAAGHSFGAVTSLRAAAMDTRVQAVVSQAPGSHLATWLELERPLEELGIPVMIQEGAKDDTVPVEENARTFKPHLAKPWFYLSLDDAGHFTFSDLCGLDLQVLLAADELGVGDVLEDGCGPEDIAPEVALPLLRRYTIGLFNAYLRGSQETLTRWLDPAGLAGYGTLEADY
ncbi:MAG: dienelactone hydrolase family protein [Myxococcales bacterium]|nr:dienelactone hydrolase family protein [Myxococcales bacterium]